MSSLAWLSLRLLYHNVGGPHHGHLSHSKAMHSHNSKMSHWSPGRVHLFTLDSLAPRRFERNFREVIFKLTLVIDGWCISCEIVLTWMPHVLTDEKSTLVQVMAWCRQATSHYLSQCWHSFLSPYAVTRPQWVNGMELNHCCCHRSNFGPLLAIHKLIIINQ